MLLKNAKLYKEEGLRDITLQSGQIQSIKPAGNISETADETVIDLEGKLVLPPYVEPLPPKRLEWECKTV